MVSLGFDSVRPRKVFVEEGDCWFRRVHFLSGIFPFDIQYPDQAPIWFRTRPVLILYRTIPSRRMVKWRG